MRGVFNDFSSEVNRSIGFYSSVNRAAKISKIIGLGNGFKLPGLQKFLQQNLSYDVEKLETSRASSARRSPPRRSSRRTCRRSPWPTAWACRGWAWGASRPACCRRRSSGCG
jgi:hypothetical protein